MMTYNLGRKQGQGHRSAVIASHHPQPPSSGFFTHLDVNPPMESICFICNGNYWSTVETNISSGQTSPATRLLLSFCDLFGVKENSEREELLRLSVLTDPFCPGCAHKMNQIQEWVAQLDFIQKGIKNLKAEVSQLMLQSLPHSINIRGTYPIKAGIVRMCTSSNESSREFSKQIPTSFDTNNASTAPHKSDEDEEGDDDDNFFGDEQNDDDDEDFNPVDSLEVDAKEPSEKKPKASRRSRETSSKPPVRRRLKSGVGRIEAHDDGRCRLCPSTFKSRIQLWKHIQRSHSGITHPCRYCDKEFKDTSNRKRHEDLVHLIKSREFVCEQCGKDYRSKTELHNHIKVVHEGYVPPKSRKIPAQCQECGKMYGNTKCLRIHEKLQHKGLEPTPCPICGRPCKGAASLHAHKKTHLSAWELKELKGFTYHYKCPLCPEDQLGFRSRENLREHYNQDHPDGGWGPLRDAMKKAPPRKNKRKYFCTECPHLAPFYWKSMLDAHVASGHQEHLIDRLSKNCRVCGKTCHKLAAARRHEETHHPQIHVCSICFFTHSKKKEMVSHYQEVHPEIPTPEIPRLNKLNCLSDESGSEDEDFDKGMEEEKNEDSEEEDKFDPSLNLARIATPHYSRRGRMINPSKYSDSATLKAAGIYQEVRIQLERVQVLSFDCKVEQIYGI